MFAESGDFGNFGATSSAFIFSLRNNEDLGPFKSIVTDPSKAIERAAGYGPVFGRGSDIFISGHEVHTHFGTSYPAPSNAQDKKTILGGIFSFSPEDLEVFYLA